MNPRFRNTFIAVMLLGLAGAGAGTATAQETNPAPGATNELNEQEALASNVIAQVMGFAETNQLVASNDLSRSDATSSQTKTNLTDEELRHPEQAENGSSNRRSSRRSRDTYTSQSRSSRGSEAQPAQTGPGASPAAGQARGTARPDFSAFTIIAERNMFDPNRRPVRASGPREKPKTVESFSLVGIMRYEKGTFAFFDGTSSSFRKALKQSDSIAGYQVAGIDSAAVRLSSGTNQVELRVGMQLRREDEGEWIPSRRPETFAAYGSAPASSTATTSATPTDSAASDGESEVLKRLKERREKE